MAAVFKPFFSFVFIRGRSCRLQKSGGRLIRSGLSSYINSSFGPRGPELHAVEAVLAENAVIVSEGEARSPLTAVIGWWRVSGPKKNVRVRFPGILSEDMSPFTLLSGDTGSWQKLWGNHYSVYTSPLSHRASLWYFHNVFPLSDGTSPGSGRTSPFCKFVTIF